VDWLKGACLAAPTALLRRYGPFDERFFMFSEDVDLCVRLRRDGVPVLYAPQIPVVHLGGMSTRLRPRAMVVLFAESLFAFYRKHWPGPRLRRVAVAMAVTAGVKAGRSAALAALEELAGRGAAARLRRIGARTSVAVVRTSLAAAREPSSPDP
jgi:GT2 family glycosyltransferase